MSWPRVQLRRIFRVVNGGTPRPEDANWGGDVSWATPIDLARVDGDIIRTTDRTLTDFGLRSGSRSVPIDSLVVSTRAPIGYVAQAATEMAFNQGCRGLQPRVEVDARYFRYQLHSEREGLQSLGQGSTFVELSTESLSAVQLVVPPHAQQRAIADYLDTETARIDALIAKKRRMLELLDERRWSLLDEVSGQGQPSWQTTTLKRLATMFTDGDWIESPFITSSGIRLIQTGNIGRGYFKEQGDRYISEETFHELKCTEVHPGDVLISRLANTVGQACIAPDLGARMVTSVDVVILRPAPAVNAEFLVRYLSTDRHLSRARLEARGTTMQRLARSQVGELPVTLPPSWEDQITMAQRADDRSRPIAGAIDRLVRQIDLVAEHRQALITAAVMGKAKIPGVAA